MSNGLKTWWIMTALAVMGGCTTYEPSPVDWVRERDVWLDQGELRFESLEDVARAALAGNRELNRLRLKRAASDKVVKATGWWDDPELDADLLRVVNPAESPTVGGVSLAFTVPLSGVKGLERKAAAAYAQADAVDILVAEADIAAAARSAAVRLLAAGETVKALKAFETDPRIAGALTAAEKLSKAGELSKTETASAKRRRHERLHRLREAESTAAESEKSLRQLLGVAPGVGLTFSAACETRKAAAGEQGERSPAPMDFTRHLRVRAAVCRLEGGEAALEAEIRRQYPDLKLGPAYAREEGTDRLGIVAGLTLPLWNRNRKGIAEAEGERNEARIAAVNAWREVVLEEDAARQALTRLRDHRPAGLPSADDADAMSCAGEITALEYLAVREEMLEDQLIETDWRRDVRLAEENLRRYEVEEK